MKRTILYGALTALLVGSTVFIALETRTALAEGGGDSEIKSLKKIPVPEPPDLATYVKDKPAAIRLGKALFWDMQAGGDGRQSCASCHSAAGADNRTRNTLNPHGLPVPPWAANTLVTPAKFPITTSEVVGSAGVKKTDFNGLTDQATLGFLADLGTPVPDTTFFIGNGVNVRQVTGRQAPPVINSVYNFRFFWDGRARETFNGVNPGGATDPNARVLRVTNGVPNLVQISITNASAASQAVGPPNNSVEMSWNGRSFPQLGKKMLRVVKTPLAQQMVASNDSVLGGLSNGSGPGLNTPYTKMVQDAFQNVWWDSNLCVDGNKNVAACSSILNSDSFTVMEANFPLFWGLAIQLYEATLIANDTPFDNGTLTVEQLRGLQVFNTDAGRCANCHKGAELTNASVRNVLGAVPFSASTGFENTAVRPRTEDGGIADVGIAGQGKFKTPHLRNVELTGPYFHNGSAATLRDVVEFYNRGGDHRSEFTSNKIRPLNLSAQQKNDLVEFMLALTDERVRFEKKPFDHPSLLIHNGANPNGTDIDNEIVVPAVGAGGRSTPLPRFMNLTRDEQFKPSPVTQ